MLLLKLSTTNHKATGSLVTNKINVLKSKKEINQPKNLVWIDEPLALLFLKANEYLIKWGWPEDVWFHVDKLSSAHVYLRLKPGQTLDDIPPAVLTDAAQLVKANSISGNKLNDIDVVYTLWSNLHKNEAQMEWGQVGFYKDKEVRKVRVERKENAIVNRLNKTKVEKVVDFQEARANRDREEREDKKRIYKEMEEEKKKEELRRQAEAEERSYDRLMQEENMVSNKDGGNDSDDFM
ncbi:Coiled-coil domain-containing protein 25 homolog,Coiled-coil domain-containing protein 25 [Lepeophtheirus salmonis]|uniref:Coiled-coil domain-containing protein 25 n=1 Tax=Lepeophtheirus salmonis TaxID=72036 RepID=A0A7R8D0P4_LEPSM|nr:Coiled-coil domain-containing protein 25 homolog,Coiled-coil domain-containing protein 25 [Lepeophtheirus salmonis]CAF2961114.1 Coiled-coil domain-containing protein 25 homolog,Coiled-coil domain-containing protein 25 [Lepeophtheirus salmonis]